MSKVEKLDLMGVVSLAVVAAALLAVWMATMPRIVEPQSRAALERAVTLTHDGRMKLTVTAESGGAPIPGVVATRTASVKSSGGDSL